MMYRATTKGSKLPLKYNTKEARSMYRHAVYNAQTRGIDFLIPFDDWVLWWVAQLGDDWARKRGCKRDQYVMARLGDNGPYAPGNIKCVTAECNCVERKTNGTAGTHDHIGEMNPKSKLTESEVIEIYTALPNRKRGDKTKLAAQYGVTRMTIGDIWQRRSWRYLTGDL